MHLIKFAFLTSIVLAQATTLHAQGATAIQWQTDLDTARGIAERENKLLLVHFFTEQCGPCRVLEATVFNQPNVAGVVHSHYVPVKINANEFQATAERFGITRVPTDVIITAQGRVVERIVSPGTPMAYISRMAGIAKQHQQQAGRDFPTADGNRDTSQPLNSAYASLPVPGEAKAAMAAQNGQLGLNQTSNPFASMGKGQTPAGQQVTVAPTNPAAAQPAAAAAFANPYAQAPAPPREASEPAPEASVAPYATAASTPTKTPMATAEPQLPPDSPPLGFFGYCPVTMKNENRWQRGDVRWGCYHRGRTYLFASAESRDEFLANGDEFAPALSGIDPVLAIDSNTIEPGKQEFGIEYDGRFYLFSSEENLRKFWSQAERYATGVRQAMNDAPAGRTLR